MKAFFTILSLVALFVGLSTGGLITPQTAAWCLLGLVILLAIGRGMGSGLIGTLIRVGIPVLSIGALVLRYAVSEAQAAILVRQLCTLAFLLFGIYLMVSGPLRGKNSP